MSRRRKPIRLKLEKIDPFKIPKGKDPTKQRPGAGAHRTRKKEKPSRWSRRNPKNEDV